MINTKFKMKKKGQLILAIRYCILLLVLNANSCSPEKNVESPPEITTTERLQQIVNSKIGGDDKLKGLSVSIRIGIEERWNLVGGFSEENIPIQANMKFGVGSITKTAVAATILKLEEEGVLSIDDTIGDWLNLNNPNIDDSITIFQLLNHLSGIRDYIYQSFWDVIESDLNTSIPHEDLVNFIGEPLSAPGNEVKYSNSNYILLGLIIRSATGMEVAEVMRTKLWTPLVMSNIYFGSDETVVGPIATPWRDNNEDGIQENISADWGPAYHSAFYTAADIFSTASDLSMWAQHLYNGTAIAASSRTKMLNFIDYDTGDPAHGDGYGLGVIRLKVHGRNLWGHWGGMRG